MLITIISFAIAIIIPLLALLLIRWLDLYKTGEFLIIGICFIAGVVALALASMVNSQVISRGWIDRMDVIRYSAPILEEILKGLILWLMVARPKFTNFVEGAVYGFAVGIGFAIVENFEYVLNAGGAGLMVAGTRVVSTNLIHATTCSVLGVVLGLTRFERNRAIKFIYGLGGLAFAMILHVGFNNLVTRVAGGWVLLYAIAAGLLGGVVVILVVKRGSNISRDWINDKLGMTDRVTRQETDAVTKIDKVARIQKELESQFGKEKAKEAYELLLLQARIGLMRKSQEKYSDEKKKNSIENELAKMRADMEQRRKKMGAYAMLYLRTYFPQDNMNTWGLLEAVIQERMAAPRPAGGPNLWANLQAKQNNLKNQAEKPKQENAQ
jgi:RsiW-degrading membrane proteinase PrsW (M82 family)